MKSKAASEVLGALMVITLITTTAGLLYLIASPIISQSQESIKLRKAEFDMLELKEKIERVRYMVFLPKRSCNRENFILQ